MSLNFGLGSLLINVKTLAKNEDSKDPSDRDVNWRPPVLVKEQYVGNLNGHMYLICRLILQKRGFVESPGYTKPSKHTGYHRNTLIFCISLLSKTVQNQNILLVPCNAKMTISHWGLRQGRLVPSPYKRSKLRHTVCMTYLA